MKKNIKITLIILLILLISLFLIRLINPTEIDDVSPGINCPEIEEYNPNTLYIIPNYNYNNSISQNEEWCDYILSLNKTLALHGITHEYQEFSGKNLSQEELDFGISEFEKCFGYKPEVFKPPQLKINKNNRELIKENNLKLVNIFHQITHKVYHCNNEEMFNGGILSNKIIKVF